MPATKDPFARMSRSLARDWWKKAEKLEGLEPKWGRGRHSLRRKFASDLMDLPLASVDCFAMCHTVLPRTRFIRAWQPFLGALKQAGTERSTRMVTWSVRSGFTTSDRS